MKVGPLVVLSGPSGSGKSTIIRRLLERGDLPLRLSVSATTRAPRPGEVDGVHYHFWDRQRFEREIQAGAFLEWADVFGNLYGTLRGEVDDFRNRGVGVLLDIDVQGALQVRRNQPDHLSIFLVPPSPEILESRLRNRHTESEDAIQRRLAGARRELEFAASYHHRVVNDQLDQAVEEIHAILAHAFR